MLKKRRLAPPFMKKTTSKKESNGMKKCLDDERKWKWNWLVERNSKNTSRVESRRFHPPN